MATYYYDAVLSFIDGNNDTHVIYPKTKAEHVETYKRYGPSRNLETILDWMCSQIKKKSHQSHLHDDRYLQLTGGQMTGDLLMSGSDIVIRTNGQTIHPEKNNNANCLGTASQFFKRTYSHNIYTNSILPVTSNSSTTIGEGDSMIGSSSYPFNHTYSYIFYTSFDRTRNLEDIQVYMNNYYAFAGASSIWINSGQQINSTTNVVLTNITCPLYNNYCFEKYTVGTSATTLKCLKSGYYFIYISFCYSATGNANSVSYFGICTRQNLVPVTNENTDRTGVLARATTWQTYSRLYRVYLDANDILAFYARNESGSGTYSAGSSGQTGAYIWPAFTP